MHKRDIKQFPYQRIGYEIKQARLRKRWCQELCAMMCNMGTSSYVYAERGYRYVSQAKYREICEQLGIDNYRELLLQCKQEAYENGIML